LGWYHHKRYVEDNPTSRRWYTHLHLWLGRLLLFLGLINMGLGIQLYGDGAAPQAIWYVLVMAAVSAYGFFFWRIHLQKRKHNDSSPFEDPAEEGRTGGPKPYESLSVED
jgi:hypothetical protein